MTDVFVSRPTWVAPSFVPGLEGFLGFLSSIGLQPRTLGTTDFASRAPLDEVIRLMERCAGAVILGYPQIIATAGTFKDSPLSAALVLPTEWNHIEAGLAHARGLPLLVIHHRGVRRGIFDRGAISNYIYELDLEDKAWPLSVAVRGAVETWKRDVLDPGSGPVEPGEAVSEPSPMSDNEVKLLAVLASVDEAQEATDLAAATGLPKQRVRYHLDCLVERRYVAKRNYMGRPAEYYLANAGRAFLAENNLL